MVLRTLPSCRSEHDTSEPAARRRRLLCGGTYIVVVIAVSTIVFAAGAAALQQAGGVQLEVHPPLQHGVQIVADFVRRFRQSRHVMQLALCSAGCQRLLQ